MENLIILLTTLTMSVISSIGWVSAEYIANPRDTLDGTELQSGEVTINQGLQTEENIKNLLTKIESSFATVENEYKQAWDLNNQEQRESYYTIENLNRFIQGGKITEYVYNSQDTETLMKFVDENSREYIFTVYTDYNGLTKLEYKNGTLVITSNSEGDTSTINPEGV